MATKFDRLSRRIPILAWLGLAWAVPAAAHHSFAQFQMNKDATVTGTVKQFEWSNPHTWLVITVDSGSGPVDWRLEGASVNELARAGWTRHSFSPGEKVTVRIHPLKRPGEPGGSFYRVVTADGRTLSQTSP